MPPMIISSSPPEANWFCPLRIRLSSSNIMIFSNRHQPDQFLRLDKQQEQHSNNLLSRGIPLPLSYPGIISVAGFEAASTRVGGEVTLVFTTGQNTFLFSTSFSISISPGNLRSEFEADSFQVPCASGLRPRP